MTQIICRRKCIIKKILGVKGCVPWNGCEYKYPRNKRCEKCKHYKLNETGAK